MSLPTSFHTMIIRRLKGGLIQIIGGSLAIMAKKTHKLVGDIEKDIV